MTGKLSAAALAVLVAVGCGDPPTTATTADSPSFTATHTEWVEVVDLAGLVVYVDCRGEDLEWSGTADVYYRATTNPSGNEVWQWKIDYATATPFAVLGLTSGDVWTMVGGEDTGGLIMKPQGTAYVEHWQANERYVNQDGDKLHGRLQYSLTINAAGEVQVERYNEVYKCPGKP